MVRTFADMLECLRQHQSGLLSDAELILALQCDDLQVKALLQLNALPEQVMFKLSPADWDAHIQQASSKRQALAEFNNENKALYLIGKTAEGIRHAVICNEGFWALAETKFNDVESQGSMYLSMQGEVQVSGPFSKREDVAVLQALLEGDWYDKTD